MSNQPVANYPTLAEIIHPILKREHKRVLRNLERAQKANLEASLTLKQWILILHYYQWRCAYCNRAFTSLDHIIPLSHGGGTTRHNCVPSCDNCNTKRIQQMQLGQNAQAKLQTIFQ